MNIREWFHHLFNPHCPECEIKPKCNSCEILQQQLDIANTEKEKLLKYILDTPPNLDEAEVAEPEPEVVQPKVVPWRIRQQMLQDEDRRKAQILKDKQKETDSAIAELEANLKITSQTTLDLGEQDGVKNVQSQSK